MVLNDIIADYKFVSSTLKDCEEYFKKCESILDNYVEKTISDSTYYFTELDNDDGFYERQMKSTLLDCYTSIIHLNSSAYIFYSCVALLKSKRYNTKIVAEEITSFANSAQNVIDTSNTIIELQYDGSLNENKLKEFMFSLKNLLSIYTVLKDRDTLLLNIEQQLFEELPKNVEEKFLRTYELRSYKNSFIFNDYAEDLRLIDRFITQLYSFTTINKTIYTRKIESGSLRIVWSSGEVEIDCISDIIEALVNGIRSIALLPIEIKLKKQEVKKASLENDRIANENVSYTLAIINSQIDILTEKLGLNKNNSEDIEKIQLLCTPLIDYLGKNPVGNINGKEYDLNNDLKYLTCHTRSGE